MEHLTMASGSHAKPTLKEVSPPAPEHRYQGHEKAIWSFVFLHDNVHIVSGSWDGTMRKWDCNTGLPVGQPWKGEGGKISSLALSPDGKMIGCGREDGSLQRWNTDGEMIVGVWTDPTSGVRSLSWSPSGDHIASGSSSGKILIRKADSGEEVVGPIETKQGGVLALAYSPSGDRIVTGGFNDSICIWNTESSNCKLVVGPIEGLGAHVTSVVWSSDGSKVYTACDTFARVFDSTSGGLLHRLKHDNYLFSVVVSPKNNVLACVGNSGIVQLWDTQSHQQLGPPFRQQRETLYCVSFSQDGQYLACGGHEGNLTLWTVKDIAKFAVPILQQDHGSPAMQRGSPPESPSPSFLNADATQPLGDVIIEEGYGDPYDNFFRSSQASLPSVSSPLPSTARRFWNVISRHRPPADESVLQEHPKRGLFTRRAHSNTLLQPASSKLAQPTSEVKVKAGDKEEESEKDVDLPDCPANAPFGAHTMNNGKVEQREDPPAPTTKLNGEECLNRWQRLMRAREKDTISAKMAPATKRPEVVEVYAVRGFQGYVALTRKKKTKSMATTSIAPLAALHASASSQAGASSQGGSAQASASSQSVSGQPGPSPQLIVGHGAQNMQAVGGPSSYVSPSHFVTTYPTDHDSDSDSIQGSCNGFLDKIYFPRGHYHEDT
ncbi:WD40-repeat-containing domain protein [Suillus ampliporus]|nr:WD40-repeat-containing domain protein [Suillus ampliporus]